MTKQIASNCRSCGRDVVWAVMESGKKCPFDVSPEKRVGLQWAHWFPGGDLFALCGVGTMGIATEPRGVTFCLECRKRLAEARSHMAEVAR